MSEDWDVKTGTLYFHLDKLKPLIRQNEDKKYMLTDKGISVCEWFVEEESGRVTVTKLKTFTNLSYSVIKRLERNRFLQSVILMVALCAFLLSALINTLLVGSLMIPASDLSPLITAILNIGLTLSLYVIYSLLLLIFANNFNPFKLSSLSYYLSANIVTYLFTLIIFVFSTQVVFQLTLTVWITVSIVSQAITLSILTGVFVIQYQTSVDRGLVISLFILYSSMAIGYFFL